ncbi:MAG: hypothetical protein OYH77_06120 [Pseudomonadota bacterium]|nr:hypothetical protein [Pseudomonadota bacterium]
MNRLLLLAILSAVLITAPAQARSGTVGGLKQKLQKLVTAVGANALVSGALLLSALTVSPEVVAEHPEPQAWMQEEIMPNDHEWEKQVQYLLVDKGEDKALFHMVYIGDMGNESLFVGRRRPYGTHLLDTHADGLQTTLVGYAGEIATDIKLREVMPFYDALDGIINLTVIAVAGVDMSEYTPATLATLPRSDTELALRAFTYRDHAHPVLEPEEEANQFAMRLLTRECQLLPSVMGMERVRTGIHNCGMQDFAIGGLMFLASTGELIGYHSGWTDKEGLALGMDATLIALADWISGRSVAAAPPLPGLQRPLATTWGKLKQE